MEAASSAAPRRPPGGLIVAFLSYPAGDSAKAPSRRATSTWSPPPAASRRLTSDGAGCLDLAWTPDGQWILHSAQRGAGRADIWAVPAAGGAPVLVASTPGEDGVPAAARDRRTLRFASFGGGGAKVLTWEVGRAGAASCPRATPISADPALSPDGFRFAYVLTSGRASNVMLGKVADGTSRPLMETAETESMPVFSPDGTSLAYLSRRGERRRDRPAPVPRGRGQSTGDPRQADPDDRRERRPAQPPRLLGRRSPAPVRRVQETASAPSCVSPSAAVTPSRSRPRSCRTPGTRASPPSVHPPQAGRRRGAHPRAPRGTARPPEVLRVDARRVMLLGPASTRTPSTRPRSRTPPCRETRPRQRPARSAGRSAPDTTDFFRLGLDVSPTAASSPPPSPR
ncbi:MAG: hypothetical protein U0838_17815 [Chloroflexota bacterium]